MMAKKQKVKAEHIIQDREEVRGQAQGRIIMRDSMIATMGEYIKNINIDRTFTLTHAAPSSHWEYTQTQGKEGDKYDMEKDR